MRPPTLSRRGLLTGLAGALLLGPRLARAAQPLVLVLSSGGTPRVTEMLNTFKTGTTGAMRVTYELGPEVDAAALLADGARDMAVSAIFAIGDRACAAAAREYATVPLIYADVTDTSVLAGRASVFGLSPRPDPRLGLTRIKAVLPRLGVLGLIRGARDNEASWWERLELAAGELGVTLATQAASSAADVSNALRVLLASADAVWPQPDPALWTGAVISRMLVDAAAAHKPIIGLERSWLRATPPAPLVMETSAAGLGAAAAAMVCTVVGLPQRADAPPFPEPWLVGSREAWRAAGLPLRKELADKVDVWVDG